VELPDAKPIFPYLGLFTLVTLNPTPIIGNMIITLFLPPLSVIRGKKFVKARSNTSLTSTSKNVARIFDSLALDDNSPLNAGVIPISPADKAFEDKRYWKIPVHSAAVFAALINRLQYDSSGCKDIRLAGTIYHTLGLQSIDEYLSDENSGNGGPNGGGGPNDGNDDNEGGGPSKGGRSFKRKGAGGKRSGKGIKKARKMSGGSETRACGESGGEFLCSFWFTSLKPFAQLIRIPYLCSE
jgi:hypothetical protein